MRKTAIDLRIKVVPGASRDAIAGMLGGRLKVRVLAPPEDGKANQAVLDLLAGALSVRPAQIGVTAGRTSPEKTVRITGADPERVRHLIDA